MLAIGKVLYLLIALTIVSMMVYGKLCVFGKKKAQFVSDYCATMAAFIGVYALMSLGYVFLFPDLLSKIMMSIFALSPFAIGIMATYNTEKFYTFLQIAFILLSISYVVM